MHNFGMKSPNPGPVKTRRWWQFWLAPGPVHHVLDAQTGKFFDPGDPRSGWGKLWDFIKSAWSK